jgi:hypothetical protein
VILMPSAINYVKAFGKNLTKFSHVDNYVGRGLKYAAIGAGLGGVSEWAGGGSFFEGAKSGAFTGATIGAGVTAWKAGRLTPQFKVGKIPPTTTAAKAAVAANGKIDPRKMHAKTRSGAAFKSANYPGVSKQVTALDRLSKGNARVRNYMGYQKTQKAYDIKRKAEKAARDAAYAKFANMGGVQ